MAYSVEFTPEAEKHLAGLRASDRVMLLDQIERQLVDEPTQETRNRKPMRPNPMAPWELRAGHLRVYYEVTLESAPIVTVRAIGVKVRNRVRIGDEWWEPGRHQEVMTGHEDAGDEPGNG